jgi:hypothetical protein
MERSTAAKDRMQTERPSSFIRRFRHFNNLPDINPHCLTVEPDLQLRSSYLCENILDDRIHGSAVVEFHPYVQPRPEVGLSHAV